MKIILQLFPSCKSCYHLFFAYNYFQKDYYYKHCSRKRWNFGFSFDFNFVSYYNSSRKFPHFVNVYSNLSFYVDCCLQLNYLTHYSFDFDLLPSPPHCYFHSHFYYYANQFLHRFFIPQKRFSLKSHFALHLLRLRHL